jgi:putative aldouronate transport system substrate-binding protein
MKRMVLVLAVLLLAAGVIFGAGRQQQATNDTTFSLLVDHTEQHEGPGWYGLYDAIERETGIKVNLMVYPNVTAVEQKNIMLSTGSYPDAMGGWIVSSNDIITLSAEKVIIPLENLMMNTVNLKESLARPGIREAMTLPDGHIYSPPYTASEPLVTYNPWINKNWLDQLGLQVPTTTDQFKLALIAFRDRIPNVGNQRIIPFSGDPGNLNLGNMAGWWGQPAPGGGNNAGYFSVINGRIESTIIRPEYREMIKYFADLNRERLLDPELFTQDLATWKAKGIQGLYGVNVAYAPTDYVEVDSKVKAADPSKNPHGWVPLPVLRAPGVTNPMYRSNNGGNTLFRSQFVITDKASSAKAANIMKWLDALYDPIHSYEALAGPLNKTWRIISQSGGITVFEYFSDLFNSWPKEEQEKNDVGGYSITSLPRWRRPPAIWQRVPTPGWENEYKDTDVRDALYKPFLEPIFTPAAWLNTDDAARVADLQTPIVDYVKQKQAEWVSGQANIDAEWDAYIAQLNRMGLQDLLAMKRKAIKL